MANITRKQKNVFDYVRQFTEEKGYAPSLEEIRKHFKLASVSTSHHYVKKLQDAGYLEKESNQPRSINISSEDFIESPFAGMVGYDSISIPVVGSANCGPADIIAEENIEGYLKISKKLLSKRDGIFVLRASGNSMNDAKIGKEKKNIEDGDFVIIDSIDRDAKDGDYVLSIIDGKANLKKFKIDKKNNQITLISEST
ncbi:MAG: transcriptional repressor LexA, partial [Candidatus Pacebacteria bacterium]|nr:transcriptional repressor LexA [Candidatus Paceibacterota bacterium]